MKFIQNFTRADVMYERFRKHVSIMMDSDRFVSVHSIGYGSLPGYLKFQFSSWDNFKRLCGRILLLLKPDRLAAVLKAYALVLKYRPKYNGLSNHFTIWLFLWSNLLTKYHGLRGEDFKIHSVGEDYDLEKIWSDADYHESGLFAGGRDRNNIKVADQAKRTREAILRLKENLGVSYRLSDFVHH